MSPSMAVGGIHSVRAALMLAVESVSELWLESKRRDRRVAELAALAAAAGVRVRQVRRSELDAAAHSSNHQGVLAWVRVPVARGDKELDQLLDAVQGIPFLLILDGVQDPHNLGACLRTADAAGVHAVIAPKDSAVGLTATVCKVASGAAQTVPYVRVTNLARAMDGLKERGIWIFGAAAEAHASIYEADLNGPLSLALGGEGRGLRRLTRERCDSLVRVPMLGNVESLNVSVAAGICLYEALRRRVG
jgi:23S rRNA (guanosine2251-2'-O)-methyltransferase